MTTSLGWLLIVLAGSFTENVFGGETCQDPDRLIVCHIETELHPSTDPCSCTHLVIHRPHDPEVIKAAGKLREKNRRLKILSLSEEGKKSLLEDGLSGVYLRLSKSLSKEQVIKNVKALATELDNFQASKRANAKYSSGSPETSSKDIAEIILELPSSPEQLAKNYDLKSLNKYVNYFIISSNNLTDSSEEGLAYHPSRLMGIDDILNADSLVDLISGLGAEHEKLLLSLPATALKFNLKDPKDNMPRAKVTGPPEYISQKELCSLIENGVWTLERDEDLTAPYAYSGTTWLAFDDSVSAAIKAKYILLRGLAGIAVTKSEADDWGHVCASRPILDTIYSTFTNLVRKPRAATLLSLQDQIHNSISPFAGDIQLSPYRIVRVVDRAGSVHVVRKEAKTEFQCSRQGYFTHPSGCNRFYRCVKFNQYSSDFTVFEYDCPAGLAFDERYEVCVWPGSLPDASACKGSSEIAPVPRSRYACSAQGYFADPENCRWFFACLDHHGDGRAPTAYEFRCPFGLVFNEKTLTCDWPWSVPGCGGGSGSVIHTSSIYPGDILEGRLRPAYAQVSDLHVSGGRIADVDGGLVLGTNLLSGISTSGQRYSNGYGYGLANQINSAFVNSKYEDNSGAYIHDPTGDTGGEYIHEEGPQGPHGTGSIYSEGHGSYGTSSSIGTGNSGQYVHDSRGDTAGQYVHSEGSQGTGSYSLSGGSGQYYSGGNVLVSGDSGLDNSGAYIHDSRGDAVGQNFHSEASQGTGSYGSSGASDGYYAGGNVFVSSGSGQDNSGAYVHDSRGDRGGAYVHEEGPDGPGSKLYLHSGVQYGNAGGQLNAYQYDSRGEIGGEYVHKIRTSSPSSNFHSGIKSSGADFSVSSGAQLTTDFHQSGVNQAVFSSKIPNTLSSGAYVHDSRGDTGGAYVHQEGLSSPESVPYIKQEHNLVSGIVKTSQGSSTDYTGGFTGGSYSINSGQYVHDSTGDKGGEYIHKEGPSGPGSVSYVHQEGANIESGLGGGVNIKTGQSFTANYAGQNIEGIGGFTADSHSSISNNGQYIHDSRGDTGGQYVHKEGPSYYQGLYAGRYSGQYIHDGSGSYIHDGRGSYIQPYVHQEGYTGSPVPLYQGVNIYNNQYARQYASNYVTDQRHLVHYGSTNTYGAHPYQPEEGVIHTYDTSRLHVQPLGYKGSILKPVGITKFSSIPLNTIKYSSPVNSIRPLSVTPSPAVLPDIKSYGIQPISVTEKPIVPLNPVQYTTSLTGIKTNGLQSLSLVKGSEEISHSYVSPTIDTKTVSFNPVQYHQETNINTGFSGYEYSKPKITFSYPEHVVKHHYAVQPTPTSYLSGYSYHPSVPVQSANTILSQPVLKTNIVSPVSVSSTPRPDLVSYQEPAINSHIARPVSVTSSRIVPLNPVQYGTKIETIQVSTPSPSTFISSHSYTPVIKTQTVRPIIVSSTPAVPLSPVQYGTKVQIFEGSTPAPPLISSHSYNPVIKTQTIHPVIISSTPAVPLNPVQYGIKTISSSTGYHYSKPIVGLSYPKSVYSTQSPPVISYTYQKPLIKTQPIHPVVSTPALPDVSISHEIPIQHISINNQPQPAFGYSYKQQIKPAVQVSVTAPPLVDYSYQQTVKPVIPIAVSTPAPQVVSYSTTPRPIIISSTPTVPLNPVQYVKPVSINTPAPHTFVYSYKRPVQPIVPVSVSTPSSPIVSYSYQQPSKPAANIAVSTPAPPVVSYSYKQAVQPVAISNPAPAVISYSTTPRPIIVSSTPKVPLNPVQYVNPVSISTPVQQSFGYSYKRPIVPVSISTSAPPVVSYSYQQPVKPIVPISISTPAPAVVSYSTTPRPIIVSSTPTVPLNPVQYVNPVSINTPAPPTFGYSYHKPKKPFVPVSLSSSSPDIVSYSYQQPSKPAVNIAVSTPAPPVVSYSYKQPVQPVAISTPAPAVISYSTTPRPIIVSSTPKIPLNPVQYVNPVSISNPVPPSFGYSYKQPINPIVPVSVSTPAPHVVHYKQPILPLSISAPSQPVYEYSYKRPIKPAVPVAITKSPSPVLSYSTTIRPIQPIAVSSTPVVPLNPVQYINPISVSSPVQPAFGYSYKRPVKPVTPISVSTPASPVVSYSYQQPIKPLVPIEVSTPAPPLVSYSTSARPVQPIVVSSTPTVPLNSVQYFSTVSSSTPAPPVLGYSYKQPTKQSSFNVPVSSSSPPSVSYTYKYQVPVSTPAPSPVEFSYHQPANPVYSPKVRYQTPLKPIAPIVSYSYQTPKTPSPSVILSTPGPFTSQSLPAQNIKQVYQPAHPINIYSYKQPLAPVSVDSPARPSYTYSQPAPFSTSTPVQLNYSYKAKGVQSISLSSTPAVPLNPVQYVKHVTIPTPTVSYSYKRPLDQSAVDKATNTVFSYTFDSKPVRPVTVSSTPAIPFNPVQYSSTPAPAVTYRPVSTYSTPSVPIINYSYQPIKPATNRPLQSAIVTTHAPEVSYSYQEEPDYFLKLKTVRPVSVTSTPVVPLNPIQYVSTTPRPITNYEYQNPVIKTQTSVVAPSVDYYDEEELHREITKIQPKPAVGYIYETPIRTTTLAPITIASTPVVPLNPVQYVKNSQPVFGYTYDYAQPGSYHKKGCCSSPSLKLSSTPKPNVLKTTAYPTSIISTKKPVVGAYFEEHYEANRQEEGYAYSRPNIKFEEIPLIKGTYSTPPPYSNPSKFTSTYLHKPVQTYANTVEEESYISNNPEHVTTLVKQPISIDTNDEDLNLHLDIPKIAVDRPVYTTTSTPQQQIVEVTTVTPVVKRVKVKGGLTRGGYYVRRQKVKVQPVITTTENYPAYFTSTIKPIYSSTIDLSSPTLYSTTVRPTTIYTTSSTTLKDDELELEDEDYDSKLLEQVSGQFGEIINAGNQGIIRQGVSTTTVSSLKDGETIVGVVKKERIAGGRNKAKVVVVSKLSDFNPLLVGKLGAECSCKSNSKTLNLQRGSSGNRGQLFYPEVQNARVPSREYLPTSSEPPKVNDFYLPSSEVPFVDAKASTTVASNSYDDQSYVEIKPINKVQKIYTSTGPAIDTSGIAYDTTTKRSINKVGIIQEKTLEKGASFDRYGPGGLRGSDETLQGSVDCQRAGLFRHPKYCNKFYACNWDQWKKRFTLHVFNCPIHLAYDSQLGACNWPSKGPACADDNLLV